MLWSEAPGSRLKFTYPCRIFATSLVPKRCPEHMRVRASLERDHRGLGPGRTSDKLLKDDEVNVESRKAMLHYKGHSFVHLEEKIN